jgi:CDP-glucose 4,6-dehydratase
MGLVEAYHGRRVLLTGHTGFKGSWLAEWLLALGAKVTGYSLPPPTTPALFEQLRLAERLDHVLSDVRDLPALQEVIRRTRPEIVFHLAAQSLVRKSYGQPLETYATNVLGTANVLEAVRLAGHPCTVIVVTTDKCYENHEDGRPYREQDPLGGRDPYSSSKAAAELVTNAYRASFFASPSSPIRVASVRAGNVIGGGDWAEDRLIPDSIRALAEGRPVIVRHPLAARPWQHVLEPLGGYLQLAAALATAPEGTPLASAFNFGPAADSHRPVAEVVREILRHWPGTWEARPEPGAPHEAHLLHLSAAKARDLLGWKPVWSFEEAIARTVDWYRLTSAQKVSVPEITRNQIEAYTAAAPRGRDA